MMAAGFTSALGAPGNSPFGPSDPVHWDDCYSIDGSHDPTSECFSYAAGVCPDPLGNAFAFWASRPCADFVCRDTNCDGVFDGAGIDPFFLALVDLVAWQERYLTCNLLCVADVNADIDWFFTCKWLCCP